MTLRLAGSARRTHRWLLVLPLGAWLALGSACEENGPLFTDVRANVPIGAGARAGEADAGGESPDSDEPGAGGASAAGGRAGAGTAAGSGGSSASGDGDDDPQSPGGGGPSAGGSGPGGGGRGPGGGDSGPGGGDSGGEGGAGVYEPPPDDGSCSDVCSRRGGRCFEGTCHFDCDAPGSCSDEQTICPPGEPCEVRCGDDACAQNVICSRYSQCNVVCEGERSCDRQVICEGVCDITCSGRDSCRSGIGGPVELLEVDCSGERSCAATVSCEGQECRLACSGRESCGRIRTLAVQNTVSCSGVGSCATDVLCLGATCDVECAQDACENGVDCRALSCEL
jgi:hypothetical protein